MVGSWASQVWHDGHYHASQMEADACQRREVEAVDKDRPVSYSSDMNTKEN